MKNVWMSWSSGKDSAFALRELKRHDNYNITGLFTSVTEQYGRVAMHSTRIALLKMQADALGLPLHIVSLPVNCSNEIYESKMRELIAKAQKAGVAAMGFGDLYPEDIRKYREAQLSNTGIEPLFPLWHRPTDLLAKEIISSGIAAVLTCIDPKKLPASFAGRRFDSQTIADFPGLVDPCGENGEFHTFVYASPNFKSPISIEVGETVERDGFVFADVLPVDGIQSVESHSNSHEI